MSIGLDNWSFKRHLCTGSHNSACQIGLKKRAAVQPKPNFEPTCSLTGSFFMTKLVNKIVKTAKYCSKTGCLHMSESRGIDYKYRVRRTNRPFWQCYCGCALRPTTTTAEADGRAQGRIVSRSSPFMSFM
jgi:hypothetical protein